MRTRITEQNKGAVFLAELKRRLFLEGLIVAIPEPDVGDDLWVVDLNSAEGCNDNEDPRLIRCQLKSAVEFAIESGDKKYTVNFTKSCVSRLCQRFYFLIGIYDSEMNKFHIACFPGNFFQDLKKEGRLRFTGKGRIMLDFFVSESEGSSKYELRMKYPPKAGMRRGRGPRLCVTRFFAYDTLRDAFEAHFGFEATYEAASIECLKL